MKRGLFLAPFLLACGGSHTMSPTQIATVPPFVFTGTTEMEQREVMDFWEAEATCVGVDPLAAHLVPFTVVDEAFMCGEIMAAGCTWAKPEIKVFRRWFVNATRTELLHLALYLHHEDWGYSNPAFGRCIWVVGQFAHSGKADRHDSSI